MKEERVSECLQSCGGCSRREERSKRKMENREFFGLNTPCALSTMCLVHPVHPVPCPPCALSALCPVHAVPCPLCALSTVCPVHPVLCPPCALSTLCCVRSVPCPPCALSTLCPVRSVPCPPCAVSALCPVHPVPCPPCALSALCPVHPVPCPLSMPFSVTAFALPVPLSPLAEVDRLNITTTLFHNLALRSHICLSVYTT